MPQGYAASPRQLRPLGLPRPFRLRQLSRTARPTPWKRPSNCGAGALARSRQRCPDGQVLPAWTPPVPAQPWPPGWVRTRPGSPSRSTDRSSHASSRSGACSSRCPGCRRTSTSHGRRCADHPEVVGARRLIREGSGGRGRPPCRSPHPSSTLTAVAGAHGSIVIGSSDLSGQPDDLDCGPPLLAGAGPPYATPAVGGVSMRSKTQAPPPREMRKTRTGYFAPLSATG